MTERLPTKTLAVLRALAEPGNRASYMRYMGRFNPHPYYFLSSTMRHCTAQVKALLRRGFAEPFNETEFGDHRVRISRKGRRFLKTY